MMKREVHSGEPHSNLSRAQSQDDLSLFFKKAEEDQFQSDNEQYQSDEDDKGSSADIDDMPPVFLPEGMSPMTVEPVRPDSFDDTSIEPYLKSLDVVDKKTEEKIRFLNEKLNELKAIKVSSPKNGWSTFLSTVNGFFDGLFDVGAFFATTGAIAAITVAAVSGTAVALGALALVSNPIGWGILLICGLLALGYGIKKGWDGFQGTKKKQKEFEKKLDEGIEQVEQKIKELQDFRDEITYFKLLTGKQLIDELNISAKSKTDLKIRSGEIKVISTRQVVMTEKESVTLIDESAEVLEGLGIKRKIITEKNEQKIIYLKTEKYEPFTLQKIPEEKIQEIVERGNTLLLINAATDEWPLFKEKCIEYINATCTDESEKKIALQKLDIFIANRGVEIPETSLIDTLDETSRHGRNAFMLFYIGVAATFAVIGTAIAGWALAIIFGGMLVKFSARASEQALIKERTKAEQDSKKILTEATSQRKFIFVKDGLQITLSQNGADIIKEEFALKHTFEKNAGALYLAKLELDQSKVDKTKSQGKLIAKINGFVMGALHPIAWVTIVGIVVTIILTVFGISTGGIGFIAAAVVVGICAPIFGYIFCKRSIEKEVEFRKKVDDAITENKAEAIKCQNEIDNIKKPSLDKKDDPEAEAETCYKNAVEKIEGLTLDDKKKEALNNTLGRLFENYNEKCKRYSERVAQAEKKFSGDGNKIKGIFASLNPPVLTPEDGSPTTLQTFFRGTRDFFGFYKNPVEHGHDMAEATWSTEALVSTCGLAIINIFIGLYKKAVVDNEVNKVFSKCKHDTLQMQTERRDLQSERFTAEQEKRAAKNIFTKNVNKLLASYDSSTARVVYMNRDGVWKWDNTPKPSPAGSRSNTPSAHPSPTLQGILPPVLPHKMQQSS